MDEYKIKDEKRKWFTMIPNIVDEMELTPHEFRLYIHLRRVAGENGECWQSTRTLAEACRMSAGAVSNSKQRLIDHGLIDVYEKTSDKGQYHLITIIDVWEQNFERFASRSPDERPRSPGETKNNPSKNNSTNGDSPGEPHSRPSNALQWIESINGASNKQAAIKRMHDELFPGRDSPDYGYIGRVINNVGGAGRLAQLMWIANGYQPSGDVLRYCQGLNKGAIVPAAVESERIKVRI